MGYIPAFVWLLQCSLELIGCFFVIIDHQRPPKVMPLYKGGGRGDVNNYRPISVLSVLIQTYEKTCANSFYELLSEHNLLYRKQFGFRRYHNLIYQSRESNAIKPGQKSRHRSTFDRLFEGGSLTTSVQA